MEVVSKNKLLFILSGLFFLLLLGVGTYYIETNIVRPTSYQQHIDETNTAIPTNTRLTQNADWKTYTDPNNYFSFEYPSTWTLKNGLDFQTDTAVYDPTAMKDWPTNDGRVISWPTHYVDILSVEITQKTAKQEADEYKKNWNMTDAQIQRTSAIKNGADFEIYNLQGENAVRYRNVSISNGKILIKLSSLVDNLNDGSVESQILNTFKFR